jgi:hypothetical protein
MTTTECKAIGNTLLVHEKAQAPWVRKSRKREEEAEAGCYANGSFDWVS